MTVGIFTNKDKDTNLNVTIQMVSILDSFKTDYYLYADLKDDLINGKFFDFNSEVKIDIMITIGGDGTILRIVNYCAEKNIPILGVNLGKLGFLAEIEKKEIESAAKIILSGKFKTEKRSILEAEFNNNKYYALNEAVLCRENEGKMIALSVAVNGSFIENFYSDGYIVSTPTGSTAYSLSSGGPVLSPDCECFVLTPINSHSLYTRPIVISDKEQIELTLSKAAGGGALILDGIKVCYVNKNETVYIRKSKKSAVFVKINPINFYSKLLKKFNGNSEN